MSSMHALLKALIRVLNSAHIFTQLPKCLLLRFITEYPSRHVIHCTLYTSLFIFQRQMREYLVRLIYCEMLGVECSWGYIHAVKFTQTNTTLDKRIGISSYCLIILALVHYLSPSLSPPSYCTHMYTHTHIRMPALTQTYTHTSPQFQATWQLLSSFIKIMN